MNQTVKAILVAVGIIAGLLVLWYIRLIIAYVLIALILSIIGRPITQWFESKNFKPALSAGITLIVLLLIATGIVMAFVPIVQEEAQAVSNIDQATIQEALSRPIADMGMWMESKGMIPEGETKEAFMQRKTNDLFGYIKISAIFNFFFSQIGNMVIGLMSILFITFFFLKDRGLFIDTVFSFTSQKHHTKLRVVVAKVKDALTRYFIGICIQVSLIAIIVSIGLSILGVNHPVLIGILAGVVNIIPYLGPLIGAFFGLLIGITGNLDMDFYADILPLLLKIGSVFALVQLLDNFIFHPYIFSQSVHAHPLEIFLVILIAGTLAGIVGMILAIPFYTLFRIIAKEFFSEFTWAQTLTRGMNSDNPKTGSPVDKITNMFRKEDDGKN